MSGAFWCLVCEPGNKYSQTVEEGFNICSAALGADAEAGSTTLYARVEDDEVALCTLNKDKWPQYPLTIPFATGTELCFFVKGKNRIYLTGFTDGEEENDDEEIDPSMYDPRMIQAMKEQGLIPNSEDEDDSGSDGGSDDSELMAELLGGSSESDDATKVVEIPAEKKLPTKRVAEEQTAKAVAKKVKKEKEAPKALKEAVKPKEQPSKKPKQTKLASGTIVEDVKVGTGAMAKKGKNVGMRYVGRLASNNKVFDQNTGGKPFRFRLGAGEVIKGWDQGLEGMQVGGKRILRIPPSSGYGARGAPPTIPGNSTLLFECELVYVK
ncbi:hypothetical protein SARC_00649 [Sphaeroforma arctica JP610]|uniref:peptidylprolyl isomerase n=1 Tax=Sphaeroforma arctica JP610 TaxID=667725 RepID=A0A0L0GG03_9EUKA|nr:hypothetical protein SARC_00649 [Sphaeroforma arctica JP610]KNC87213.1 hypothetical protein SARC_00649 [Sphaeroforma arctica JP610]|eukprot:XP_014161115.1 hypothetical protein SARC_00649 [Sphaeroforma arctica JP610]